MVWSAFAGGLVCCGAEPAVDIWHETEIEISATCNLDRDRRISTERDVLLGNCSLYFQGFLLLVLRGYLSSLCILDILSISCRELILAQ